MGPVWSSGGSQATEEWWDNQSVRRAYVRAEDDDNELSISDDMNTHYHHQIISSAAPKCDTNTNSVHTCCSDISSGSPLDFLPFSYLFSETSAQVYALNSDLHKNLVNNIITQLSCLWHLRITDYDYNVCIIAFWNIFCWRLNTSKIHINLFLKIKIFRFLFIYNLMSFFLLNINWNKHVKILSHL